MQSSLAMPSKAHQKRASIFRDRPLPVGICYDPRHPEHGSGKNRYETRSAAKSVLRKLSSKGRSECRVYRCAFCGGHHLTRMSIAEAERKGLRR